MADRTVHARWSQMEVVRYNRQGHWYLEPRGAYAHLSRQQVSCRDAAKYARWCESQPGGQVTFGLPGGQAFDRFYRETQHA